MTHDRLIRNPELAPDQLACRIDFLPGKIHRLRTGKIQRRGKIDDEIVAESVLRQRRAAAVCDLPTRRGNIEDVSARELLRLECRDNRLFFWRLIRTRRRRGHQRLRARCRRYRQQR